MNDIFQQYQDGLTIQIKVYNHYYEVLYATVVFEPETCESFLIRTDGSLSASDFTIV